MPDKMRADPVLAIGQVNEFAHERDQHPGGYGRHLAYPAQPPPAERDEGDVASVLGLPVAAVTPAVLSAVTGLLSELDRLRDDHARLVGRLDHLDRLAAHDCVVPALNRRGLLRAVEAHLGEGEAAGTLAVLHVSGVEALGERLGLACAEAAVRHVAGHLVGTLRATDPLGLVGGSTFAMLLVATGLEDSRLKVRAVMEQVNQSPFTWEGEVVRFALFSGYHPLTAGEGAEAALDAADRARRGRPVA